MFRTTIASGDSPRQIGMGVALGSLIGILPKDSLIPCLVGLVLLVSTANLLSALLSGFVFSWVGYVLDPVSHSIGKWILTRENLQSFWATLYELPVVPWTRFENTVVMGSLVVGLLLLIPVYGLAAAISRKYGPPLHRQLRRFALYRWVSGAEPVPENLESETLGSEVAT